jgi:hypothetical protein
MRTMYIEDIAHKRENYKMDLWTFGDIKQWLASMPPKGYGKVDE